MKSLEILLSKERLQSYANLNEHFENLALIGRLAPKLLLIEICLRNITNDILLHKLGDNWLEKENETKHKEKNLSNHQLVSKQSLDFWCKMIEKYKLYNDIFHFRKSFDLKRYDDYNTNRFYYNGKKRFLRDTHKVEIILNWIHTIRNRAFHAENLLKVKIIVRNDKQIVAPRITTFIKINEHRLYFGIMPNKIEIFLNECLNSLNDNIKDFIKEGVARGATD
ncbi:hypothetical protein [Campylobacter upsaliensis]|uniref:hypothetical protein n=1 Tax=Campylobacter upsaliensis TaxID=28080 RepID=UPI0022EA3BC0|nr:hypothetical protein [Campylobacter upsaliensis]